jgi:hypothetical protein
MIRFFYIALDSVRIQNIRFNLKKKKLIFLIRFNDLQVWFAINNVIILFFTAFIDASPSGLIEESSYRFVLCNRYKFNSFTKSSI